MALAETLDKAGVSLKWLLYGDISRDTDQAMPNRSKVNHPPPVNLVLQQPAMIALQDVFAGPILTKVVREVMADWSPRRNSQ